MVHSPSKEGHGQDRAAVVTTSDEVLAKHLLGATAFDTLGVSTAAAAGTVRTLTDIAKTTVPKPQEALGKDEASTVT